MTRRLEVKVYEADGSTHVRTLTKDQRRAFRDTLHTAGAFSFDVIVDHADDVACTDGRIVKFFLDGTARFAGIIEPSERTLADPDRRASGRMRTIQGRGVLALLENAIVFPELPIGRVSPPNRQMSWVSADFDASGWVTNSTELKQVSDSADPWSGSPDGFPDQDAWWIGAAGDSTPGVAPGVRRHRKVVTVPVGEGGDHLISVGADDAWRLWVDGDLAGSETQVGAWGVTKEIPRYLDEGDHVFALEVVNYDRPNPLTNVTGAVLSVAPMIFGGVPGTPIDHTDSTWVIDTNEDAAPGMSVGDICDVLLTEATTERTGFTDWGVNWDFTALVDSNGAGWINTLDVTFPVRTNYLEVVGHFDDELAAEFWMDPDLTLHAYQHRGDDLTGDVTLAYGANFARLRTSHKPPGHNRVLAQMEDGRWVLIEDTAQITTWGAKEVGLDLGAAPTDTAAVRQGSAYIADQAEPGDLITDCQVAEIPDATPYVDWGVGDTVTVDFGSDDAPYRCEAISVTDGSGPDPVFVPELVPT